MAAQYIPIKRISSLDTPIKAEKLDGSLFTTENQAHEFIVSVRKNGVKQTVTGSVSGKFIRANGTTIFLQGSIVDGDAVVRLHQDCYNVQGRFTFNIFNTQSGVTTCIYSAVGKIDMGSTETVIDAGDAVPDVSDVVAKQEEMTQVIADARTATTAANTAATNVGSIVARPYSSSSTYTAGKDYCTHNGNLYKAKQDISTAEEWTASHWTQIVMGDEVTDLKSALDYVDQATHIYFTNGYAIHIGEVGDTLAQPTVATNAGYAKVACDPGDVFIINGIGGAGVVRLWAFVDSDQRIISKSSSKATGDNLIVTAPENAAYIVINTMINSLNRNCVKGKTLAMIVDALGKEVEFLNGLIQYMQPLNLFNKESEDNLKYQYYDGTTLKTSTTLGQSELIPVIGSHFYKQSTGGTFVLWYNEDQTYGGKIASNSRGEYQMPVNAYYARFIFHVSGIDSFTVYETDSAYNPLPSTSVPFTFEIQEVINARDGMATLKQRLDYIENKAEGNSEYNGLSGVAFGTSLTYRAVPSSTGGYLRVLPELSGITFDNQGLGNSQIVTNASYPDMMAKITGYTGYADKRIAILEGFVNDWSRESPLGTYTDTELTTICGAVRYALDYMLTQNPNLTIFLVLDHYGKPGGGGSCASTVKNGDGLTQYQYYEEIAKVGESMGIHVIKLYAESGISERTPQYIRDNIHPTDPLGVEQTAKTIWAGMKKWFPNVVDNTESGG